MFYYGEYRVVMDDKGRMRIPNKIKSQLGSGAVTIFAGGQDVLYLMTEEEFKAKVADLAEDTPFGDQKRQNALRMFSSTVFTPEEDAQGRFILPAKPKSIAGIKKNIVFLGAMNRVEIWAEEKYEAQFGLDKLDVNSALTTLGI